MHGHPDGHLVVDLGGTKLSCARVRGEEVQGRSEVATPSKAGPDAVVQAIVDLIVPRLTDADTHVGLASTGRVVNGVVNAVNTTTMPGWQDVPLAATLASATGRRVEILNDAHAAAYGEWRYGAGRGIESSFVFVTVSTGIGAGAVVHGQLLQGANGLGTHLGFLALDGGAEPLEWRASGTALARRAEALRGEPTTSREALALAEAGDAAMHELIEEVCRDLGVALSNLQWMLDPAQIAVGGGLGLANGILERLQRHAYQPRPGIASVAPTLVPAHLGVDAGLVGIAAWLEDHALA